MKITVMGAGYVGLVTAACLAEMGNSVVGLDLDEARVAGLRRAQMPIHEPGLEVLVARNLAAGRLQFSTDAATAIDHGSIVFIAVGTPSAEDGSADLRQVMQAAATVGEYMNDYKVVVNKSTVPVGSAERVRQVIAGALQARSMVLPFSVVSNPEFLKEGAAVDDFMSPDRVVVGADDDRAMFMLRSLYAPFLRNRDRMLTMDPRSAELTKYAANAMLAMRISFMNEMALLADAVGADVEQVRQGVGSDPRIGTHFLYAGCGWGGSCFPKDVKALAHLGDTQGLGLSLLKATMAVNDRQRQLLAERVVQRFGADLHGRRFAVWGLAFKPGTDDVREAPSRVLIEELLARGAEVSAYDPVAMPNARAQWTDLPGLDYAADPYAATLGADALLVVTEWREFRSPDFERLREEMAEPLIYDGRNLYDPATLQAIGLEHVGIGRGQWQLRQTQPAPCVEEPRLRA
jgi:UDPglucose 6-dehydrogenase